MHRKQAGSSWTEISAQFGLLDSVIFEDIYRGSCPTVDELHDPLPGHVGLNCNRSCS